MHRPVQPCDAEPRLPQSPRLPPQPVMRLRTRWLPRRLRLELPRSTILWLLPAMDIRGDSNFASSAPPAVSAESPRLSQSCCALSRSPWVSPHPAPSGFACDVPSRRFEGCALRRRRRNVSGFPRTAFVRYRRRPVCGSPRICVLRRQMMNPPSRLGRLTLRLRQRESPGRPESSLTPGFSDVPGPSFALALRSFGGADRQILGSPRFAVFRLAVYASPSCPGSTSTAGSMMNPSVRELCILRLHGG